jgi:hypothetical protein
LNWW